MKREKCPIHLVLYTDSGKCLLCEAEKEPETPKQIPHLTIIGRRWFDKVNGNTYHSVEIYDDSGKQLARVPFAYGYGDQYQQTALDALVKLGIYPDTPGPHGGMAATRHIGNSTFPKKVAATATFSA